MYLKARLEKGGGEEGIVEKIQTSINKQLFTHVVHDVVTIDDIMK